MTNRNMNGGRSRFAHCRTNSDCENVTATENQKGEPIE